MISFELPLHYVPTPAYAHDFARRRAARRRDVLPHTTPSIRVTSFAKCLDSLPALAHYRDDDESGRDIARRRALIADRRIEIRAAFYARHASEYRNFAASAQRLEEERAFSRRDFDISGSLRYREIERYSCTCRRWAYAHYIRHRPRPFRRLHHGRPPPPIHCTAYYLSFYISRLFIR